MIHKVSGIEVSSTRNLAASDIQSLRRSVGWQADDIDVWVEQLEKAKAVRFVSYDDRLVGIGFLIGLRRHAIIADVCVDPKYQRQGIGHEIVSSLVKEAQLSRYVTLTFDEASPELQSFYEQHAFVPISNAMQLRDPNHQN